MKRCQPPSAVRAALRRFFHPACERLEAIISPNDLGLFRAVHPLAGLVDPLGADVQLVQSAAVSSGKGAAFDVSPLQSQANNPSLDAYFASLGTSAGLSATGKPGTSGSARPAPANNDDLSSQPGAAANSGLANPLQDPLSAAGPFGAGRGAASSGGSSAGTTAPATGGSSPGASADGTGGS